MYLEDFLVRLMRHDRDISPAIGDLLCDLAREVLVSRPTRPDGLAEESRTPRRMAALLERIAHANTDLLQTGAWREIDAELRAMGFLSPRHADAGGEP